MGNVLLHLVLGILPSRQSYFFCGCARTGDGWASPFRSLRDIRGHRLYLSTPAQQLRIAGSSRLTFWPRRWHRGTRAVPDASRRPALRASVRGRTARGRTAAFRNGVVEPDVARPEGPDQESAVRHRRLWRRKVRRPEVAVLAVFGQHERERHHSIELLHGLEALRRVPQGHLRAVEVLDAPLRLVQQPVLPEVDRVHAGRWSARSRANGARAVTITRCSSTAGSISRSRTRSTRRKRRTGLGCMSCHSIAHVDGTMGNGGFTIEYPPLHDLASQQ